MAVQAGKYEGRAVKREDGEYLIESTKKGTTGARFDVEIVGGECASQRVPWQGWFADANVARTLEQIEIAGAKVAADGSIDWSGLGSTTFPIVIEFDDYSSEMRVKWINGRLGEMPAASAAAKQTLAAKLAGAVAARPAPTGAGTGNDNTPF